MKFPQFPTALFLWVPRDLQVYAIRYFAAVNVGSTEGGPTKHSVSSSASSATGVITNASGQKNMT